MRVSGRLPAPNMSAMAAPPSASRSAAELKPMRPDRPADDTGVVLRGSRGRGGSDRAAEKSPLPATLLAVTYERGGCPSEGGEGPPLSQPLAAATDAKRTIQAKKSSHGDGGHAKAAKSRAATVASVRRGAMAHPTKGHKTKSGPAVTTSRSPQAKAEKCRCTGRATTTNKSKPSARRERHLKSQNRTLSGGLTAFSWGYPYCGRQCGAANVASVQLPTSRVRGCRRHQSGAANISSVGLSKAGDETRPDTTVH